MLSMLAVLTVLAVLIVFPVLIMFPVFSMLDVDGLRAVSAMRWSVTTSVPWDRTMSPMIPMMRTVVGSSRQKTQKTTGCDQGWLSS
ncbi:hypothetical protein BDM02DRAFT_3120364 [Thelephora ganbajun]|uniref:Uncharacterized protein n=1 Tax=Thelephora ganbajun TaxID=370292 RepID=A0ACB6Z7M1_THEGA|nr:hypothetical protein BDM02DRAFT_3120364 [Thelephora ganbajun]